MDIRLYSVGTKLDVLWITCDRINAVKLCKHFFFHFVVLHAQCDIKNT